MFTHSFQSSCRAIVPGIGAIAIFATADSLHADVITANFVSDLHFNYRLDHMPDLDQRRLGVPGDGNWHCVPTSTLNLILYAANHGFGDVQPGPNYWQSPEHYDTATGLINTMGFFMQTSFNPGDPNAEPPIPASGGTGGSNGTAGLQWYLDFQPNYFIVNHHLTSLDFTTNFTNIAKSVIGGNIGTMSYGRYDIIGYVEGLPMVQRNGGHATTIVRAYRNGNDMEIWVRDPADTNDSLSQQSPFTNRVIQLTDLTVVMMDNNDPPGPIEQRTMTALNYDPTAERVALIDGHRTIRPKAGYSFDSSVPAIRVDTPKGFSGGNTPTHQDIPSPFGVFFDVTFNPLLQEFFAIAGDPNQQQLYRLDMFGNNQPVQLPSTPRLVKAAANGSMVFVTADGSVRVVSANLATEAVAEIPIEQLSLNYAKIEYQYKRQPDDGSLGSFEPEGIVILLSDNRKVLFYPMDLSEPIIRDLPTLIAGNVLDMAIEPDTKRLWLITDASNTVYGLKWDASGNVDVEILRHPEIESPKSLDTNDLRGKIIRITVNVDDAQAGPHVKVFSGESGQWVLDPDSPFHNLPVAGNFRMMQSSSNFDPDFHSHTRWTSNINADELEILGEPVADCLADLNHDGEVDVIDLLELLGAWGTTDHSPADFDVTGNVDVGDLLILLGSWGTCP